MSGTNHRSLLNSERLSSVIFRPAIPARNSAFAAGAQGLGWLSMATSVSQALTPVRLPVRGQVFNERGVKLISPARMRLRLKKGGETDETYNESKALCPQCSMWLHEKQHRPMWYHIPERELEMIESCPWYCAQAQCHGTTNAREMGSTLLYICQNALGDIVTTLPSIHFLKQSHPHSTVDVCVNEDLADIFAADPNVDRVIRAPAKWFDTNTGGDLATGFVQVQGFRSNYEVIIDSM